MADLPEARPGSAAHIQLRSSIFYFRLVLIFADFSKSEKPSFDSLQQLHPVQLLGRPCMLETPVSNIPHTMSFIERQVNIPLLSLAQELQSPLTFNVPLCPVQARCRACCKAWCLRFPTSLGRRAHGVLAQRPGLGMCLVWMRHSWLQRWHTRWPSGEVREIDKLGQSASSPRRGDRSSVRCGVLSGPPLVETLLL